MNKITHAGLRCWPWLAGLVLVAGCGKAEPPAFHSNVVEMDRQGISPKQEQDIANILGALFGTPDKPFVLTETGLDRKKLEQAAGPVRSDQFGKESGLYRRHCGHCHGTTGDGLGPTALVLNPYPRDYRQGKFKFKSTERPDKPTTADLEMILRHGIPGTAMPSFDLLPDTQIQVLIEYVKYLSMRGETELKLISAMADLSEGTLEISRTALVDEILKPVAESWSTASEKIVAPAEKPSIELALSIEKGRELFYDTKRANCIKCHGLSALGDGQTNDYDDWNKPLHEIELAIASERESLRNDTEMPAADRNERESKTATTAAILKSDSLPVRTITPRNLRLGVYRGGRRPVDLFRRIYAGINGVPMPGVGPTAPGGTGTLSPEEIWSLVDYVRSLPLEAISEPPRQRPTAAQARF
ncbi:MAG: c-type cytochrome [Planctomycetia bacterium]|nr:c-type cytochrome [Planctomycetia bacterium]